LALKLTILTLSIQVNQVTALDIQDPSQYDLTFEKLQDLQYIEGNILSLTAKFKATRATISILKLANKKGFELGHFNHEVHSQTQTELESYDLKLDSYQVSLENLLKRSKGIFSLVSWFYASTVVHTKQRIINHRIGF